MKHWITYLIVAVAVYSILAHFRPVHENTIKGIWLPIHPKNSTQKGTNNTGASEKKLGWINLELHALKPTKAKTQAMFDKALSIAKQHGADKINVRSFSPPRPGMSFDELSIYSLQALALKNQGNHHHD